MNNKLIIKDLQCQIDDEIILKNINLELQTGDVLGLLGPNGVGKSTLLKALMNHFLVKKPSGSIIYNDQDIAKKATDQIAHLGFYYAAQNPIELDGIPMVEFLKCITNKQQWNLFTLMKNVNEASKIISFDQDLLKRNVNVGFSGGQKKKNEILQAILLKPIVMLIDEIDSGLDVDAMKDISAYLVENSTSCITIVISHDIEFLKQLKPNKIAIIANNQIMKMGDKSLIAEVEKNGFKKYIKQEKKLTMDECKYHG